MRCDVANANRYVPTEREKAFQSTIENQKYERDIINGLAPFLKDKAPADIKNFYSADELAALAALKGTERDVEARMPVKMTRHFFDMAQNSQPLQRLVKANPDETLNLAGSEDPGRDWTARRVRLPSLERLAAQRPDDGPTLLLVHRPELFAHAAELGFPLVLAGHTHGGQLALPTPGGHYNLARVVSPLTRGLYRRGGSTLYVNRGLGVGGPAVRVNCAREIAIIELGPLA